MSKVSEVKVSNTNRVLGEFHVGVFNVFEEGERKAYAELRTKANDRATGISIDHIQQVTRVVVETESGEEGPRTTRKEELHFIVQYWEKRPSAEEPPAEEPPRQWSVERGAKS